MLKTILQAVVFIIIATPFAYMAFDVFREILTSLVKWFSASRPRLTGYLSALWN